jgi:hypothetical protein
MENMSLSLNPAVVLPKLARSSDLSVIIDLPCNSHVKERATR